MDNRDKLLASDSRRVANAINRTHHALDRRDYDLMRECLAEARPHLMVRGVVVDAVIGPGGVPLGLAALVMNTQLFGSDWQRAIPSEHISHIVGAIVVVKEDGSLEAVKNRWGEQGRMYAGLRDETPLRIGPVSEGSKTCDAMLLLAKMIFAAFAASIPERPCLPMPSLPKGLLKR